MVWYSKNIPKWSFILWLAVQQKLNTRDRLLNWGMIVEGDCTFCTNGQESHHHLFFQCPLSLSVWDRMWRRSSNDQIPSTLPEVIAWYIQHVKGTSFRSLLLKNVLAATMYNLWMERNQRVFNQNASTQDQIILRTISCVKESLCLKRGVDQTQLNTK